MVAKTAPRRSQRSTAGNRLEQLLADEGGLDDFYKQEIFQEDERDDEFSDSGDEDVVDSDFDIDEDEGEDAGQQQLAHGEEKLQGRQGRKRSRSQRGRAGENAEDDDDDDDDDVRRRRLAAKRKAYVDPKASSIPKPAAPLRRPRRLPVKTEDDVGALSMAVKADDEPVLPTIISGAPPPDWDTRGWHTDARKHLRHSTQQRTLRTHHNWLISEERRKSQAKPKKEPERRLTQAEMLEEAKVTEQLNLASLDAYRRREEEGKKLLKKKPVVLVGPRVVFCSRTFVRSADPFATQSHHLSGQTISAFPLKEKRKTLIATGSPVIAMSTLPTTPVTSHTPSALPAIVVQPTATRPPAATEPMTPMPSETPSAAIDAMDTTPAPPSTLAEPVPAPTLETVPAADSKPPTASPTPMPVLASEATPATAPSTESATEPATEPATAPPPPTAVPTATVTTTATATPSQASSPVRLVLKTPTLTLPDRSTRGKTKVYDGYIETPFDPPSSPHVGLTSLPSKSASSSSSSSSTRRAPSGSSPGVPAIGGAEKDKEPYSRHFVNFYGYDPATLPGAVTLSKLPYAPRINCVISGRPARYVDPLTMLPYADVAAFKALRARFGTAGPKPDVPVPP